MGLVLYWYDAICYAIVGVAFIGSLYVLWNKEGPGKSQGTSSYEESETLLRETTDDHGHDDVVPIGHVSSPQLWTTCWRALHPACLLATRLLSLLLLSIFLSLDLQEWGASIFIYYTEWTFSLVILYFVIGSVVSAHGCRLFYIEKTRLASEERSEVVGGDLEESTTITSRGRGFIRKGTLIKLQSHYYQDQALLQRAGFWGYLMQTAYQTCAGAVILTDIVFWCIIVPFMSNAHLGLNLLMGCMHTMNLVFLLLDTSINCLPFPWFRLAYFVLWSSIYVIFQWLIHLCGFTWWPYPFLELSTPWAPFWYLALALSHIACYGFYSLIVRVKDSLFSKLFPHSYLRSY